MVGGGGGMLTKESAPDDFDVTLRSSKSPISHLGDRKQIETGSRTS